jgi:hypothetical protein
MKPNAERPDPYLRPFFMTRKAEPPFRGHPCFCGIRTEEHQNTDLSVSIQLVNFFGKQIADLTMIIGN